MGMTEMKCPACGAPLKFSAVSGKVECEYCGTTFDVEQLIAPVKQPEAQSTQTQAAAQGTQPEAQSKQSVKAQRKEAVRRAMQAGEDKPKDLFSYDWGDIRRNMKLEPLENAAVYICKSCGAELVTTDTTASLKCPYCDNEIVLDDRLSGSIRPNGIIPFKVDAKQPMSILKEFYKKKPLLPKDFLTAQKLSEVQGVYVPYWLFSGTIGANLKMEGTRSRFFRQGDYDCTEVSYFDIHRDGDLGFSCVPVDAHSKVDNLVTESLEPYDFSELREFQTPYLAGYVTDRFDANPDECLPRAEKRMFTSTEAEFKQTATGYDTVSVRSGSFNMRNTGVQYVLLPAYFIKSEYKGKEYRIAINGQTGKIVGELPIDKGRRRNVFLGTFLATAAAVFAAFLLVL